VVADRRELVKGAARVSQGIVRVRIALLARPGRRGAEHVMVAFAELVRQAEIEVDASLA
jgi:hypothetical protein